MGLESIFPGLPPTPADVADDLGDLWTGVTEWLGGYGPSEESIKVANLVKGVLAGPGASSLYRAQQVTERQVDTQTDLAGQAHEIVARLETAWSGQSSDGARQLIRSFADIADESSTVLASNARNLQRQVDGFERMKNSLERMPEPPPEKAGLDPDFDGSSKKAIRAYQHMAERNRQRYQSYVDDTNDNLRDLDEYFPDLPSMSRSGGGGPQGWPGSRPGSGPGYTPSFPGQRPGSGPGGGWGGPGSGGGSGYRPDFTPSPYVGSDYAGGSGYTGSEYGGTTAASFGPGAGGAGGFGPGAGGAGAFGPGAGGAGAGAGGTGAGGVSGVAGPLSGAGAAGAGAGGAGAGRGGAGGRLGGGMMGGGAGGAGRGQGGDDEDYERKRWLQENDPEGLFGTDEMTPPLVLGADEDDE